MTKWVGRALIANILLSPLSASAHLQPIKVTLGEKRYVAPRWLYEAKPNVGPKTSGYDLYVIKKSHKDRKFEDCVQQTKRSEAKRPALKPWLATQRLECSILAYQQNKKNFAGLRDVIGEVNQVTEWLHVGPQSSRLRSAWVEGSLIVLEEQITRSRKQAWETFSLLEKVQSWLSREQKAKLYKFAGEMAFLEQKLATAVYYLEKSYKEENTSASRQRWLNMRAEYYRALKKEPPVEPERATSDETLEANAEELAIYNRMREAIKANDYISAVEDGMRLIKEYPGGRRAQFATKQILSIYLSLAQKNDEKLTALKSRVIEQMGKADGVRLYEWAQTMVAREYFADAVTLSQQSLEQIGGQPVSTKVLLLLAQSALHVGDFKNAQKYFEKIIREHSGTKASMEAIFRLGLALFREGNYPESVSAFEKYLALRSDTDFEIPSLYWLWRAQQRLKSPKADEVAQELIRRYPLSYYGIRARYELNGEKLNFESGSKQKDKFSAEIMVTSAGAQSWLRFTALLSGGWLQEAQAELEQLPEPTDPEGMVTWAWLWGQTLNYVRTFEILQSVWQRDPSMLRPSVLKVAYPQEFLSQITAEANKYKLPPLLILSLIRQESSFRPNVQSPAGAMGLMQVMSVTGREIASDLRIKLSNFPSDLYQTDINIRIGTNYVYRLSRNFEGHVPLILAAYNAGIGNIRGWLNNRVDLAGLKSNHSSQIDSEIWFDELPWLETSGYIKSILRNWILYRYLEKGEVQFSDPIWRI